MQDPTTLYIQTNFFLCPPTLSASELSEVRQPCNLKGARGGGGAGGGGSKTPEPMNN